MTGEVSRETATGTMGYLATAFACAVSSGLTVITGTVLVADALRSRSADQELRFYLIAAGTLGGLALAGFVGWRLLEPIGSTYRRGGLAMVAAFATVVLMLICTAAFELFGRAGLLGLLFLCATASAWLAFQTRRLRGRVRL